MISALAMKRGLSVDFCGYWQRGKAGGAVDKFVESAGTKNEDRGSLRREVSSRVMCGKMHLHAKRV